ncbi:5'-3' exoribonuclease 1, partial [Tachysurus ichikawai]
MNSTPGEAPGPPLLPCVAAELSRVCVGLNMGPPEFTFLRNRQ